ncbi:TPA: hypothetical protein L4F64_005763 [Pseudomonas aeruginosa]|nr:hypothetical protein [Pseudomonas aeruginosa]HBO1706270.1 hypothetical protein [Pseudomonas aeruginosa]
MRLKGLTLSCKSHNHFGFSIPVCPGTVRNIPDLSHRFPYSYLIPFHLEHAFKPDLDGPESAKPASPPPKRFKLAPLGSVVRKKECATSSLPDEQSSCAALEFCTDCAQ